jgi:uncharacterized protein YbjT (DUF2867 family)
MKLVITGSLGHISRPLTIELVGKNHSVIVISSKPEKQKEIESLGAVAAIGSVQDAKFLASTFNGADGVYTMIPPSNYFNPHMDLMAYCQGIGNAYAEAIEASGVKRVVHLSSIGAHLLKDSGLIVSHRAVEDILSRLPDVALCFLRPSGFYYNLYSFLPRIKKEGFIAANYGGPEKLIWVSPLDIASAAAEELERPWVGKKVRYVSSDELSGDETARILGEAIGKPDLKWVLITSEQMKNGLQAAGMNHAIAEGMAEMFASQQRGELTADYYRHRPQEMGKVKLTDFAREFATTYKQN